MNKIIFFFFLLVIGGVENSCAQTSFEEWLNSFYPLARKQGIREATWRHAFNGITTPDMIVLERATHQPEFKTEIWDYLDTRTNRLRVEKGQRRGAEINNVLRSISKVYGIPSEILLAIWSLESNYGEIVKQPERLHYVPQALATLAWKDARRRKFACRQLIAALKILQSGDIDRAHLTGSWAGAMGQTQFIPTSYLAYGVDFDGDGRRDIWNSEADALATAANLLKRNGWRSGKPWGYEVVFNGDFGRLSSYIDKTKTLAEWQNLGFSCSRGGEKSRFPEPNERAELKAIEGVKGPLLLCMKNFFVIKRYNNADAYALAISLLADKIAGRGGLLQEWPRPPQYLTFEEKIEVQQLLNAAGFYSGNIDGVLGPASREAITRFQQVNEIVPTGKGDRILLGFLRQFLRQ